MSSSEAKTNPASDKKLREARRKGQVAQQRDFGAVVALATGCGFLWIALPHLIGLAEGALDAAFTGVTDPGTRIAGLVPSLVREAATLMGQLFLMLIGAAVLTSLVLHGGAIFSLDPVSPKLSNMDPVKGLGRIFGKRSLAELAKNLLRLLVGAAATALILRRGIPALLNTPSCGLSCLLVTLGAILAMLFAAYVLIGLLFAVPDLKLQQSLFLEQMKMTKSEVKRESKDANGTPEIKNAQRRVRAEIANTVTKLGVRHATLVIFDEDVAVGLRYVKSEVGVPILVARARGEAAAGRLLGGAQLHLVPLWRDGRLARGILDDAKLGQPAPQAEFQGIAHALAATAPGR